MSGFSDAVPMLILVTFFVFVPAVTGLVSWWHEARGEQRRKEKQS